MNQTNDKHDDEINTNRLIKNEVIDMAEMVDQLNQKVNSQ
jgi:hypothetical protein